MVLKKSSHKYETPIEIIMLQFLVFMIKIKFNQLNNNKEVGNIKNKLIYCSGSP